MQNNHFYIELKDKEDVKEIYGMTLEVFFSRCERKLLMNIKSVCRVIGKTVDTSDEDVWRVKIVLEEMDIEELIRQNMVKYLN